MEFATEDHWESHPAISADSLVLFLENWRIDVDDYDYRGGLGDIAVAFRSAIDQPWSRPFNLGATINTDQFDSHPFLTADGSTLYFSHLGNDGPIPATADIYQAPVLDFTAKPLAGDGDRYTENFDGLGPDTAQPFLPIPAGWTFTANDVVFNNVTTRSFPASSKGFADVYNAGTNGADDRTLVTDVTDDEAGELDFRALVSGTDVQALRLGFDIEAWQVRSGLGANPGEAAFHVVLEADSGDGFEQIADLGEFSTGETLVRPAMGDLVDGNDPAYRRSFDSGPVDLDVPAGATLRTRWIGTDNSINVVFGLDNVSLRFAAPGDANIDGVFNSTDLIEVLANGEYEDNMVGNSSWSEGDWTNDNEFDSGDLVEALASGCYEQACFAAAVPEPTGAALLLLGGLSWALRARCCEKRRGAERVTQSTAPAAARSPYR
jgi:hypothetical protein